MGKCVHCGGKANIFTGLVLKDGEELCKKCKKELEAIGLYDHENWRAGNHDRLDIEGLFYNPDIWVKRVQNDYQKEQQIKSQQEVCIICGNKTGWAKHITADQYAVCGPCSVKFRTINVEEYFKDSIKYVNSHEAEYFKKNAFHVEEPIKGLIINFDTKRIWDMNHMPNLKEDIVSFESIIKFGSDIQTYEVTVGKKGHPIARAVVGNIFGPAGAVIGAMTAKDTRHQETKTGKRYINIYYKNKYDDDHVKQMTFYTNLDSEIVAAEECLKRAFKYNDSEDQKAITPITESSQPQNGYDDLIELKKLMDMGIITSQEFELKKKIILGI